MLFPTVAPGRINSNAVLGNPNLTRADLKKILDFVKKVYNVDYSDVLEAEHWDDLNDEKGKQWNKGYFPIDGFALGSSFHGRDGSGYTEEEFKELVADDRFGGIVLGKRQPMQVVKKLQHKNSLLSKLQVSSFKFGAPDTNIPDQKYKDVRRNVQEYNDNPASGCVETSFNFPSLLFHWDMSHVTSGPGRYHGRISLACQPEVNHRTISCSKPRMIGNAKKKGVLDALTFEDDGVIVSTPAVFHAYKVDWKKHSCAVRFTKKHPHFLSDKEEPGRNSDSPPLHDVLCGPSSTIAPVAFPVAKPLERADILQAFVDMFGIKMSDYYDIGGFPDDPEPKKTTVNDTSDGKCGFWFFESNKYF